VVERLAFLCDANSEEGYGHFMRSLRLARSLVSMGLKPRFFGAFSDRAQGLANDFQVELLESDKSIGKRMQSLPADIDAVVVDSYRIEVADLVSNRPVVLIDDYCELARFPVAGVINFTLCARQFDYLRKGARAQALGPDYFLPQPALETPGREFRADLDRILLVIGSEDRYRVIPKVLEVLAHLRPGASIRVLGADKKLELFSGLLVEAVPFASDMQSHYDWADFCITSGGLAKYECAWLARPAAVIANSLAEQGETFQFAAQELCFDVGYAPALDKEELYQRLAKVLENIDRRLAAHASCLKTFATDSADATACFTANCFGVEVNA
jgi:UDP-2,4-diacetamido-2,4,6-trideoxy-beta-L-altropyranose hydrolase